MYIIEMMYHPPPPPTLFKQQPLKFALHKAFVGYLLQITALKWALAKWESKSSYASFTAFEVQDEKGFGSSC